MPSRSWIQSMTARVLFGLIAGAVIGTGLAAWAPDAASKAAYFAEPLGRLWLNALQMTVVPLVFTLVVVGVTTASDAAASGRIARQALAVFIVLLTAGACFVAIAAPMVLSWLPKDPGLAASLRDAIGTPVTSSSTPQLAEWFSGIVPSNAIAAAAQSAMLPLVVFALFFGFGLTRIQPQRRARVVELFQAIADTMIVIVRWILWVAPIGVFALVLVVCARVGGSMLTALGYYVLLQCSMYLTITLALYLVAMFFGGEPIRRFAAAILPAQAIAASTQSSLASLPAMLESAQSRLGYTRAVTALVLPMAVSLFRITSPMQYLGAATFIAWAYGIDLSFAQLSVGVTLAVVLSLGAVGLPGQVSFMASTLPVTQSMGLPIEPLGILLAIDTVPDVFATVGNVTADLTATSIVARQMSAAPQHGAVAAQQSETSSS
ncbi:MAG TPA: dicarboxylate/amino acid:cation symporter [Steroidobacter sp.]